MTRRNITGLCSYVSTASARNDYLAGYPSYKAIGFHTHRGREVTGFCCRQVLRKANCMAATKIGTATDPPVSIFYEELIFAHPRTSLFSKLLCRPSFIAGIKNICVLLFCMFKIRRNSSLLRYKSL